MVQISSNFGFYTIMKFNNVSTGFGFFNKNLDAKTLKTQKRATNFYKSSLDWTAPAGFLVDLGHKSKRILIISVQTKAQIISMYSLKNLHFLTVMYTVMGNLWYSRQFDQWLHLYYFRDTKFFFKYTIIFFLDTYLRNRRSWRCSLRVRNR